MPFLVYKHNIFRIITDIYLQFIYLVLLVHSKVLSYKCVCVCVSKGNAFTLHVLFLLYFLQHLMPSNC